MQQHTSGTRFAFEMGAVKTSGKKKLGTKLRVRGSDIIQSISIATVERKPTVSSIALLLVVSAVISIPVVLFVKNKSLAMLISVFVSTIILNYIAVNGFELTLLITLIVIALCAAVTVNFV